MTFDPTQPTDTTKIRNLGVVIRPNWEAIEEGETSFAPYSVNLQDRTPLGVSNDPTAMTSPDACRVYCKQDGNGNPELYAIDPAGNVIQITQGGSLGSSNTSIIGNDITINGDAFGQNQFVTAWGEFSAGILQYGVNMSTSGSPNPSQGRYNVDVDADVMVNGSYSVLVTNVSPTSGSTNSPTVASKPVPVPATPTTIALRLTSGMTRFSVIVVGGN